MSDRPRILVVAPNASDRLGGESILPLHYFRRLSARGYQVRMITHERNRAELESSLGHCLDHMYFVADTRWHRAAWRAFSHAPERIRELIGATVLAWLDEASQARLIRRLIADDLVDLIHQPTPVSPLAPSALHRFGIPLVIGPMNGGMDYPPGYEDCESAGTRLALRLGRRIALAMNRIKPGKHRATVLLVANERTRNALPDPHHPGILTLVENGVDLALWGASERGTDGATPGRLRLVCMGRFVRLKGIDITLRAVSMARRQGVDVTLDLIGDGEQRPGLEALAADLGLADHVIFHGFQPQARCAEIIARADALILASLRDCGGAVILEAMASGIPAIASAWGGPLDYLTPDCGILVDPVPRGDFADRLAVEVVRLARDPGLRLRLGRAAQATARARHDWERKIDRILEIYEIAMTRGEPVTAPAGRAGAVPAPARPAKG